MKDYITKINVEAERRFMMVELRASEDKNSRTIEGYAAKFNTDSEDFGGWIERIAPGAFDEVLEDEAVALFNHDPNLILARNKVSLTITQDAVGLLYRFDAPNTTAGDDLLENVRNGNVKSSSFAFQAKEIKWTYAEDRQNPDVRTIVKMKRLFDVSPVTYPAYPDTTVAKRSLDDRNTAIENERQNALNEARKRVQIDHEIFKLKHNLL